MIGIIKLAHDCTDYFLTDTNETKDKGSAYSCCYEVINGTRRGFLKAFDYSAADRVGIEDPEAEIQNILQAYQTEREILKKCKDSKLKNVIELYDHGAYNLQEVITYPRVVYLILEYAEGGDVTEWLQKTNTIKWKLTSLHQLTKGLREIHNLSIAHQDIKPTNTVISTTTKLSDFGSAVSVYTSEESLPKRLKKAIAGSWAYAPPDLLYGYIHSDPISRRIGCDLYLLGSMIAFYFTDMSMTSLIKDNLAEDICWTNPATYGRFSEVETYLNSAFNKALIDLENRIEISELKQPLTFVVKCLCQPNSKLRGHPKTILYRGPNYDLERFLTIFSRLIFNLKN